MKPRLDEALVNAALVNAALVMKPRLDEALVNKTLIKTLMKRCLPDPFRYRA